MRKTVVGGLAAIVGFGVSLVGSQVMTAAPSWVWAAIAAASAAGGLLILLLSDPIHRLLSLFLRRRPMTAAIVIFLLFGSAGLGAYLLLLKMGDRPDVTAQLLEKQQRLEFLQHRGDVVTLLKLFVFLDRGYAAQELGSFRTLLTILRPPTHTLYVSSTGPANVVGFYIGGKPAPSGVQHTAWTANADLKFDKLVQDTMIGGIPSETIEAWSGSGGSFATLQSFDNSLFLIHLSEALWPKVSSIAVLVNDYVVFNQPRHCLAIADAVHSGKPSTQIDWPPQRKPSDDVQWVKVVPVHYKPGGNVPPKLGFMLAYSAYTPALINDIQPAEWRTLAIPNCDWYGKIKP